MAKSKSKGKSKSKKVSKPFLEDSFTGVGRIDLLVALLLGVAVWFTYSSSSDREFVHWDDNEYVFENDMVMNPDSEWSDFFDADLGGLISVATGSKPREEVNTRAVVVANYHPITMLTLHWNWQSGAGDFGPFYRMNLILHFLNGLLIYLFVVRLYPSRWVALFASLIFIVHPNHVESVAWISERKDVLYTFFFMLGLLSFQEYQKRSNLLWYVLAFVAMILSCLSKPAAVVFPVVLSLLVILNDQQLIIKRHLNLIPMYLLSLLVGLITLGAQSEAINDSDSFSFFDRLTLGFWANARYIFKFFFPGDFATMHPIPSGIEPIFYVGWAVFLVFLAALAIGWKMKKRFLAFGLVFYFVTIILVLQFLGVGSAIIAERYTYLPYVGLSITLLVPIHHWLKSNAGLVKGKGGLVSVVLIATILVLGSISKTQAERWVNSDMLWSQVVEEYPNAYLGYKSRGYYYSVLAKDQGNNELFQRAILDYDKALTRTTKSENLTEVHTIRGYALFALNRDEEAVLAYNEALALDPNNDQARSNRGVALVRLKRYDEAFPDLNATVNNPEYRAQSLKARSVANFYTGRYSESIADVDAYLQLIPTEYDMMNQKAVCQINLGQYAKAIETLTVAIQQAGNGHRSIAQLYRNRALAYQMLGDNERAQADRQRASQF